MAESHGAAIPAIGIAGKRLLMDETVALVVMGTAAAEPARRVTVEAATVATRATIAWNHAAMRGV